MKLEIIAILLFVLAILLMLRGTMLMQEIERIKEALGEDIYNWILKQKGDDKHGRT